MLNKIDQLEESQWSSLKQETQASLLCSAHTGVGLPELLQILEQKIFQIQNQKGTYRAQHKTWRSWEVAASVVSIDADTGN